MFVRNTKFLGFKRFAMEKMAEEQIQINNLEKRIEELERIIHNQPLIKKYQKTLDIFLKNAQD